jgi:hypothetical protein
MPGPLWIKTRDLHHACEQHPVGAAMASGSPPMQWYADWLFSLYILHLNIDPYIPNCLHRADRLCEDIISTQTKVNLILSAIEYSNSIVDEKDIVGAAYVLTGAHLMGGEIMRKRLINYPTSHLEWNDRKIAVAELTKFREREDVAEQAKNCFAALLRIMDEIEKKTIK